MDSKEEKNQENNKNSFFTKDNRLISWFDKTIEKPFDSDKLLDKFLNWFDLNKKIAFLLTLLVGIITHITMITETIMSQDGLWNSMEYYRPGLWELALGRWGLEIIQRLNFYIAIPTVSTISSLLMMAIAAVFLVDLFEFKSKKSVIFMSLFLAVAPTLTITFLYVYTAFGYCSNFLIATLVIWLIYKYKHKCSGFIFATLLFAFVLSIYQSYIGVSIGLCMMLTVLDLIRNEKTIKEIFLNVLKTIIVVILGGFLYYGLTNLLLKLKKVSLTDYNNLNSFSVTKIFESLGATIPRCYTDAYRYFFKDDIIYNTNYRRDLFSGIFFIVSAVIMLVSVFTIKEESKKMHFIRGLIAISITCVLPIGLNFIGILVPTTGIYILTAIQLVLIIPFVFAIIEQINGCTIMKWVIILTCIYNFGTYYVADNATYAAIKMRYNQAYSVAIRIMDRIETTPGYNKDYPICVVGIIGDNNYPKVGSLHMYSLGDIVDNPIFHGSYSGSIGTLHQFLKVYLGQDIKICNDELYEAIVTSDEFQKLESFPNEGCSAVIKDTMVIKLSNYIPMPNGTLLFEEY